MNESMSELKRPPRDPLVADETRTASSWRELFIDNPMLEESRREWRRVLRTSAAFGRGGQVLVVGIIVLFYGWLLMQTFIAHQDASEIFLYLELGFVTIAMPGSVYAAISGEREKATWDALVLTRLTPAQIVAGKVLWRLKIMAIIGAGFLIPAAICHMFAYRYEADASGIALSQLMIGLWGLMLCSFGLWVSSRTLKSIATLATVAITIAIVLIGLPVLYMMFGQVAGMYMYGSDPIYGLMMSLNPFTELNTITTIETARISRNQDQTGLWACLCYAVLIPILLRATYRRLKALSEPDAR